MPPRISVCLDLVRQILETGVQGAPLGPIQFQRMADHLGLCRDVARRMEAILHGEPVTPEDTADGNVVSLLEYLEAKNHARPQA